MSNKLLKQTNEDNKNEDKIITNISEFIAALEKIRETISERSQNINNDILFYRGHSDKDYKLIPSIYRDKNWIDNEDIMFKELMLKCPNEFKDDKTTFQMLVRMQHYSLPTRLLDITSNSLIALYFACSSNKDKDGEVVVFRTFKNIVKYFDSDTVSILSNLAKCSKEFDITTYPKELPAFNNMKKIQLLIHQIRAEKPYFQPIIDINDLQSVIIVKPLMDNPRIIRQDGAFLLFGIKNNKSNPATIPDMYIQMPKIIIKKDHKKEILNKLETLGISAGSIFPEIDQVSSFIKNTYKSNS